MNQRLRKILIPVVSVILALAIGGIFIVMNGVNPITAYGLMIKGAFGSVNSFGETLVKAIPLALAGLAVTFAYRNGTFNIGADGQIMLGAIGSMAFALAFPELPSAIGIFGALVCGALAGAFWGFIPGALKAWKGTNEVISTIMMNYIAMSLLSYMVIGPMKETTGYNNPQTDAIAEAYHLPILIASTRVHFGLIITIVVCIAVLYYLFYTSQGFKLRMTGLNPIAALYSGVPIKANIVKSMVISGGIAGLAGAVEMLGVQFRLMSGFGSGYGYDGIATALIGQLHPVGVLVSSVLFGALRVGGSSMQRKAGIPTAVVDIIQALIIIFVVASAGVHFYKKRKATETTEMTTETIETEKEA
ncbi:ABC transporter permease [Chakrabartyella piscis]|uniref:ABC transporter permease n=1 Tax=Chakrabartyella piscis TaxID=2918914 RepID=UPI00295849DF|nr:ABC transporter permease [Chakrabartyella piscis]